jgi:peptide/nickel transport system permease protein
VTIGLSIVLAIVLFGLIGPLFRDTDMALMGKVPLSKPPSLEYPLGTEALGRDMLSLVMVGAPNTFKVGLVAGGIGTLIGIALGFVTGYFRGPVDTIIRSIADIMLTIPGLAILIVIASYVRVVQLETIGLIVALFAWARPTRQIRAQVLTLRERAFVEMARLSGISDFRIIFGEIFPNLLPYIVASFVGSVSGGILASIGLELLGLGPKRIPTLGATLYWALSHSAIVRGMWWWMVPPIAVLILIFSGLFLANIGLDEFANPRLKGALDE